MNMPLRLRPAQSGPNVGRRDHRVLLPLTAALLVGCQSYEPAPLDLVGHRDALEARLDDVAPINAFLDRLEPAGPAVPELFDLDDGLTVAEGEVLALFYNPDLRLARLEAGVALATLETAGLWQDPQFGFEGAEILSPSGPFEHGLTLSLTIPISGAPGVERDRAGAAHEAELSRIVEAEWSTRARVRTAWAAWTVASERLRLLADAAGQLGRISSIAERLEAAGELMHVEARLLRAELVEIRTAIAQGELAETRSRMELLGLLGLPSTARVDLVPAWPASEIEAAEDATPRLIAANATLAVRRAEYRVAEETLRLEVRKQYPDVTFGGGHGAEDDDRLLLGLSLPIPLWNANRRGIAEARARREVARAMAETTFERLALELAIARTTLDAARAQRRAFERELIPMLDEQSSEVEQLADLGDVSTLLLLETVTRHVDAKSRLLDLRLVEATAAVDVARLLGPEHATSPPHAPAAAARGSTSGEEGSR